MYVFVNRKMLYSGLEWAVKHCDNMTELIKMDDDIFVDLPIFLQKARINIPENNPFWILGLIQVFPFFQSYDVFFLTFDVNLY